MVEQGHHALGLIFFEVSLLDPQGGIGGAAYLEDILPYPLYLDKKNTCEEV